MSPLCCLRESRDRHSHVISSYYTTVSVNMSNVLYTRKQVKTAVSKTRQNRESWRKKNDGKGRNMWHVI